MQIAAGGSWYCGLLQQPLFAEGGATAVLDCPRATRTSLVSRPDLRGDGARLKVSVFYRS